MFALVTQRPRTPHSVNPSALVGRADSQDSTWQHSAPLPVFPAGVRLRVLQAPSGDRVRKSHPRQVCVSEVWPLHRLQGLERML